MKLLHAFLLLITLTSACFALSQAPVNFKKEIVSVNGKDYVVTFNDGKIDIREKRKMEGSNMLAIVFIMAGIFWFVLFGFIFWKLGILIEVAIATLIFIVVVDMIRVFRKRWRK